MLSGITESQSQKLPTAAHKMKFSIQDFLNKCDQIYKKLCVAVLPMNFCPTAIIA